MTAIDVFGVGGSGLVGGAFRETQTFSGNPIKRPVSGTTPDSTEKRPLRVSETRWLIVA
jgi:hypothetical protein